jgi:hypothetical protein
VLSLVDFHHIDEGVVEGLNTYVDAVVNWSQTVPELPDLLNRRFYLMLHKICLANYYNTP